MQKFIGRVRGTWYMVAWATPCTIPGAMYPLWLLMLLFWVLTIRQCGKISPFTRHIHTSVTLFFLSIMFNLRLHWGGPYGRGKISALAIQTHREIKGQVPARMTMETKQLIALHPHDAIPPRVSQAVTNILTTPSFPAIHLRRSLPPPRPPPVGSSPPPKPKQQLRGRDLDSRLKIGIQATVSAVQC